MSYWNKILTEVLNKHDPLQPTMLTNVREYLKLQELESSKVEKTTKSLRGPKQLTAKKRTQVTGRIKKYQLGEKFLDIYFTKREAQVAFYFIRGKSTIQTAKLLNLSRRTVEFYINNMKVKLNCRFKSDLISLIIQSDFLKLADSNLEISCQ